MVLCVGRSWEAQLKGKSMRDRYIVRVRELRAPLLVVSDSLMRWGHRGWSRGHYSSLARWLAFKAGYLAYRLDRMLFRLGLVV